MAEPRQPYGYRGPCLECGTTDNPAGYTKRRCRQSCYFRWIYHTRPERHEAVKRATSDWNRRNLVPGTKFYRWYTAYQRAYRAKKRAARQERQP